MRLEQLRYFEDVAKTGSINFTAQKLFATQQTVNAALKRLEEELGYKLFERSSSGVTLTEHGKIFLRFAQSTLESYQAACQEMARLEKPQGQALTGELTIGDASALGELALPEVLKSYKHNHPKVHIRLVKSGCDRIMEEFLAGQYDIIMLTAAEEYLAHCLSTLPKDVGTEVLLEDQLVVCLRANDPLAEREIITQAEFADRTLAVYSMIPAPPFYQTTMQKALHVSDDAEFCKKLMLQNLCVTLMSQMAFEHLFRSKKLSAVKLEGTTQRVVHTAIFRQKDNESNIKAFLQTMAQFIHKLS